jgi:hypothetical protein
VRGILQVLAFSVLGATMALATPAPSGLQGTVLNTKGQPVASARVFVQGADGKAPRVVTTDARGHFHTTALGVGMYDVRAEAAGSWSPWEHNVVLKNGQQVNLTLKLMRTSPPAAQK